MPLDVMADLDDYIPDADAVDRGDYRMRIRDARETSNHSLMVSGEITHGRTQANGKDPLGRDYTIFVSLHPENIENDFFRKKSTNLLKKFFLATGMDSTSEATECIGKEIWVTTQPRKNKETGKVTDDPQDFRAYEG
jgi:hypothetical protein